jgi:hypothetical protein
MAYLQSVVPHPTDSNKLRLTFSAALDTATVLAANFTLSPAVTTQWAAVVAGSGNTQVDLHFGTDLTNDADVAMWRFDESAGTTAADISGNGYTLTDIGSSAIVDNGLYGRARSLAGTTGSALQSGFTTAPRTALLGEWTIDILMRRDSTQPDAYGQVLNFVGAANTAQAENSLLWIYAMSNGGVQVTWENGTGVGIQAVPDVPGLIVGDLMTLVTITKQLSGSKYVVTFINNGKARYRSTAVANADGGNSASMRWGVGVTANATSSWRFKGLIDTIRVKTGVRTEAAIATYANDLLFPLTRGTTYTVTCSGVLDSLAAPISGDNAVYTFTYLGLQGLGASGNTVNELYYGGTVTRSFEGGGNARTPLLDLTAQRTAGNNITIQATNGLDAVSTTPGDWVITGASSPTVTSVAFTPGNSYLVLTTSGSYETGSYSVTPADGAVQDSYGQFWSGPIPLDLVAGGSGAGANLNTGFN